MKRSWAMAAIAALTIVAACGGDDGTTSSTTTGGAATTTASTAPAATTAPGTSAVETTDDVASTTTGAPATPGVINVPADHPTIQAAVDAAEPGDLILIAAGTYHEAVNVVTDDLTLRGLDRAGVVLDGQFNLDNGVRVLGAKGVTVENMTAKNYTANGFFWTGATGYRGAYLTAFRNGDYGIYAFDSVGGELTDSYASGSPDAGVYIGQCYPCDAVIKNLTSEHNGLGYSGTNSGGNLLIVSSTFRYNRAGIVPNSGSYELCYPERETTIVGNSVYSNNQPDTPAIDVALLAQGNGILSAGGRNNVIERNLVYDHNRTGIGLVPFLEEDPNDDQPADSELTRPCSETKADPAPDPASVPATVLWDSHDNQVTGNVTSDNREGDLVVASAGTDLSTLGNCFSGNTFTTTAPTDLEALAPCGSAGSGGDWSAGALDVASWIAEQASLPPSVDYQTAPTPEPPADLPNMPDAATAPAAPASATPPAIDLASIPVPTKPA
jgi:parallel beta-helix repeat protein